MYIAEDLLIPILEIIKAKTTINEIFPTHLVRNGTISDLLFNSVLIIKFGAIPRFALGAPRPYFQKKSKSRGPGVICTPRAKQVIIPKI